MRALVHCERCLDELMSGEEHSAARCLQAVQPMLRRANERATELGELFTTLTVEARTEETPESTEAGR